MDFEVIFILFWLYSFLGFIIETIYVSVQTKRFVNRGFLLGPYCPIYGTGAIFLLLLKDYQTDPFVVFILSILICSIIEYITSYLMELIFKVRWWDYSKNKFNLNGRICLFNSICFGLLGMILVCYLNPFFLNLISNLNDLTIHIITLLVLVITLTDIIMTLLIMFDIRKMVVNYKERTLTNLFKLNSDNTEEISKKVRNLLKERSIIHKHLSKSYRNLKVYKNNFLKKTEELKKYKKLEKEENLFIITSIISLIIGFIIGKLLNNLGLCICISFVLNVFINSIYGRRNDDE